MIFPPVLLRIASLPATALTALNHLSNDNNVITEKAWKELYYTTVVDLCQLSQNKHLLNGLQMTSHSLAGRVQKIIDKLPPTLRKKEQQTARSLWQIVSRMAGKTSPFSSFTHLGQVNKTEPNPRAVHHHFRLNNILLGQLLEILRYHPPYFKSQKTGLNYTVELVGTTYVFLHNTRNIESVQCIEKQPVIDLILAIFKEQKFILFEELVECVLDKVDAEKEEIADYIFTLAEYGLLVWELPVAPTADNWWQPLAERLRQITEDPLCQNLDKILTDLGATLNTLSCKTPGERAEIQQTFFTLFKNIWEAYIYVIPAIDSETILKEGLKRITDKEFLLKPETLFYEDTRLVVNDFWTENNWQPLRKKMSLLSQLLLPLTPSDAQDNLVDFYQKKFNQPISLWTFYQKWLPEVHDAREVKNARNSEKKINLKNRLATLPRSESLIHVTPDFLQSLSTYSGPARHYGSLVLPFQIAEEDHVFLDTFVSPNARLAGRFLPLFSKKNTEAWRTFHRVQSADKRWIENQDYSFFNANVHPPLLAAAIEIPSLSVDGINGGIPITEIQVQLNKDNTNIILTHKNKTIEVVNLSLEATDNRSGLYQLLCKFEPIIPSKNILVQTINDLQSPTDKGVIQYPRVVYDRQIILQRATWFFPKSTLPFKAKGTTHFVYLDQLRNWQRTNNLPTQFYYTLHFDNRATGKANRRNEHKPQFFDSRNPISVDLWHRDLKKVDCFLKIEEMLPSPEQLIAVDGVARMVEALVMI